MPTILVQVKKILRGDQAEGKQMDIWSIILTAALLAGVWGWCMTPFVNGILWFCDWAEGVNLDWGLEVAFTIMVPFVWVFAIVEIMILYASK